MPALTALLVATLASLPAAGRYVHWGVISVSLTNLLIIIGMLVLFGLALVVPFPRHRAPASPPQDPTEDGRS